MAKKSSKTKLDLKSRKILYELDINARQSFSRIGKKVGLSKDTVNYRIKQMEESGLIKKYYPILDVAKLGYLNFRVFMRFYNVTPKKEKEIINYLDKHPRVGWLVSISGKWDANMLVWAESVFQFKKFWDEFKSKYRKYLEKSWVSVITQMVHHRKAFLIGKERDDTEPEITGGVAERKIDNIDFKILRILSLDARSSLLEISKKLKISPKVADYRIKKMVRDKVILSFRALLDLSLLGVLYFKVHFTLQNMTKEKEKELFRYAQFHPNIMMTDVNVGGADFEMEIYAESNEQFHEIRNDIKERFADRIRDIETFEYYKEYKWVYMPLGG